MRWGGLPTSRLWCSDDLMVTYYNLLWRAIFFLFLEMAERRKERHQTAIDD